MTTLVPVQRRCAVCGEHSVHQTVASCSTFGSTDLDLRPPEMRRSTMGTWLERCPGCGYCHESIEDEVEGVEEIVRSPEYRALLDGESVSELATAFLCQAHIDERVGDLRRATWDQIRAAWAFDDAAALDAARTARGHAIELLDRTAEADPPVADPATLAALRVDLLRRGGRFDEARAEIGAARSTAVDDLLAKVLNFQAALLDRGDAGPHTVEEAVEGSTPG